MVGQQFTWANSLPDPTYEKLDSVLIDTDWEEKYPMVSVRSLKRIERLSNHDPILLTTGIPKPMCKRPFKFELGWLQHEGFHDMVKNVWDIPDSGNTPILRWNNKMRAMHKHMSGWASHTAGIHKKRKASLIRHN
jgi:hypothetical protein